MVRQDDDRVKRVGWMVQRRQSGLKSGVVVEQSKKNRFFQAYCREISICPGKFSKNFEFFWQISEKFRFFQANFHKISNFYGKFSKNFDFFRQFHKKFRFSWQKIAHLQLLLGKLFYFASKVTTFELP